MAGENETAGTPTVEGGDARGTATAGTPPSDGRNAPESPDSERWKEALIWKDKAEKADRLAQENAELKAKLEQPPVASAPNSAENDESYWSGVENWARQGDPISKALLAQRRRDEQRDRDIVDAFQLRDIPEEKRPVVTQHYLKNRGRVDVKGAYAEIRNQELEDQNRKLAEELKRMNNNKAPEGVKGTTMREVPAAEHKARHMSGRDYDREIESLRAQQRHGEVMAMQEQYVNGEIVVDD